MLTMREGGAAASAPKCMEDDSEASNISINDLGDDGAAMHALRRNQPWEAEAGGTTTTSKAASCTSAGSKATSTSKTATYTTASSEAASKTTTCTTTASEAAHAISL